MDRRLGYGNLCRLIITDYNIPTITITALWQSGEIGIGKKEFTWKELVPRRKKILKNLNRSQQRLRKPQAINKIQTDLDGLTIVKKNGKFGFEKSGEIIIPVIYDSVEEFKDGISKVSLKRKFGFIDSNGKQVIPIIYEQVWYLGNKEVILEKNKKKVRMKIY